MKNIQYILPFLSLLFFGCERVIDVDLNEAAPAIVIEGNLSSNPYFGEVKISMTSSYFDTVPQDKVSGAKVSVVDNMGGKYIFNETNPGIYKSVNLKLRPGNTYQLSVEAQGKKYEASSKLNTAVAIDSMKYYYEDSPFLETGYYINVYLFDPPGVKNYYRLKYWKNKQLQNTIDDLVIFNDRYVDGNSIEVTLFNQPFEFNDTIDVQLISLDEGAYEYLKTFRELVNNNPGSAAPANPNTNISNGALGYFSVWSSSSKSGIIREE